MSVEKLTPPFIYSYQCGSTILVSYIPVYMYVVFLQIIVDISRTLIIFYTKYNQNSSQLLKFHLPRININTSEIISNIMSNLILLLTYGLSSPILSVSVMFGLFVTINCWLILIGKPICSYVDLMTYLGNDDVVESQTNSLTHESGKFQIIHYYY